MTDKTTYRCAVYTRKSHEEGLDQDFNSLDAQSEACKAYIASQAGLRWKLRDKSYDDGGISGGHMDRPGLRELITDIKAGLIDVIVVYKVDRLTRSLTDFAKLVDIFDEYDVSFVSVTQAFNTTTSMGRLTLNVLLSFAQFEREVTAERIRDKIAASKAKGIWMGGTVPLGYRVENRKLHIVEAEAQTIRALYELYIQYQNVRLVKAEVDKLGLVTRLRTHKSGHVTGGKPFHRGHIYHILSNPIYIGQIQHKDKVYEGKHEAIISKDFWDQVQTILKNNTVKRTTPGNSKSPALLAGLLYDAEGHKLVPHHANKKGTRYYYYVSQKLKMGDQDTGWRVPMGTLEDTVKGILCASFGSEQELFRLLPLETITADQIQHISAIGTSLSDQVTRLAHPELKALLNTLIETITLKTDQISITFRVKAITETFGISLPEGSTIILTQPMTLRRRGQEMKMVFGGEQVPAARPDTTLIKLISKAHLLKTELESGATHSIKDFALKYGIDHGDAKNLIPVAYLAPDIIEKILSGHHPIDLTARRLKYLSNLPISWADQRQFLGFA